MVYEIAGGNYLGDPDPEPYFIAVDGDVQKADIYDRTPDGGGLLSV